MLSGYLYSLKVVVQSPGCPTICNRIHCSTPGFPVLHYMLEFAQTHVHWVGDAIQPSFILCHPLLLLPSSFPASESSPMSWLLSSGGQHIGASASDLPMSDWSDLPVSDYSRLIFCRIDSFGVLALQSRGLSRVLSSITIWKHQFFSTHPSLWSNSHIHAWLLEKP